MTDDVERLINLLKKYNYTMADMEFIIRYMKRENISPQLAMRRIKSFDKLKDKLEDTKDKDEIEKLRKELQYQQNELTEFETIKNSLEVDKKDLETQSSLLSSEAEQLQEQLKMLQEMHMSEDDKENDDLTNIKDKLVNTATKLKSIIEKNDILEPLINPILKSIDSILSNEDYLIDDEAYQIELTNFIDKIVNETKEKMTKECQKTKVFEKKETIGVTSKNEQKIDEPDEAKKEKLIQEIKPDIKKKVEKKSEEKEGSVPVKTMEVLTLFLEFISEANTDDEFKKRITAITETDEAYEHLGSIALSQVYSYQSKGLKKKDQLIKLLNSWMKTGVPW